MQFPISPTENKASMEPQLTRPFTEHACNNIEHAVPVKGVWDGWGGDVI